MALQYIGAAQLNRAYENARKRSRRRNGIVLFTWAVPWAVAIAALGLAYR